MKIQPRIPVLVTADVGTEMDDQWTIASAAMADEFDVRGIGFPRCWAGAARWAATSPTCTIAGATKTRI